MSAISYSKAAKSASFVESDGNKTEVGLGDKPLYFKNNGLFSENYLSNHLGKSKDPFLMRAWETEDLPKFNELYEWMLSTWQERREDFETMKEAQIEEEWIRPILQRLGWEYVVQPDLTRHGKRQIPDYALFDDVASKRKAQKTEEQAFFSYCSLVADAKAMSIDLDGKALDNTNPSFQIMQYLTYTNKDWGILTNGKHWRLYSLKSKTKFRSYFEVNVEKFLNGNTREDSRFKYFFNFFSRDAFAEKNAGGQSFIDVVFADGEQYAQQVETELKDRAFELVEMIANGFQASRKAKTEEELQDVYSHSLYYLFRLIFILNCEAKGLLNISRQLDYFRYSLRSLCIQIKEEFETKHNWSQQPRTFNLVKDLFNLLASGDSSIGIHGFGKEVFETGNKKFFDQNVIPDKILNEVLLRLSCQFDKKTKNWSFIDYQRLSVDHMGSIFEGLLEFKLTENNKTLELVNSSGERKSTGSYYTPDYIVDFIVQKTLSPLVEGKRNDEILKIRVLDPAMGSAHFLLGVIRFLEDKFLENINSGDNSLKNIEPAKLRWEILHNCLFGSDINPLAVELAKFSLWMFTASKDNCVEPLSNQLFCKDSILDMKSWDQFKKQGGFDAVVGNPPYVRQEHLTGKKEAYSEYKVAHKMADLYSYFIELGHDLVSETGRVGLIVSNKWMRAEYGLPLRKWITGAGLVDLVDFGDLPVFKGIAAYPCIVVLQKGSSPKTVSYCAVDILNPLTLERDVEKNSVKIKYSQLKEEGWSLSEGSSDIVDKVTKSCVKFESLGTDVTYRGILTGYNEAFVIDELTAKAIIKKDQKSKEIIRPFVIGKEVKPFSKLQPKQFLILARRGIDISKYPAIEEHLTKFKKGLEPKPKNFKGKWEGRKSGNYKWYELQDTVDYIELFEKPKIMYLVFQVRPAFTLDQSGLLANNAVWCIDSDDQLLLSFLNSKLGWYLISSICTQIQGGYQLIYKYLAKLPIPDRKKMDKELIAKIEKLALKRLSCDLGDAEKIDEELNSKIYSLFGLTKKEIEIVEKKWPQASKRGLKLAA